MAFAFLSMLVTLAYFGKLKLNCRGSPPRCLSALVFVAIAWAGHGVQGYFLAPAGVRYGALTLDPAVTRGVPATVERIVPTVPASAPPTIGADIERIQQSGVLRVGYNAAALPFSYFNDKGDLVGYDVAFAYDLARSLNVAVRFVPFEFPGLERDLRRALRHRHGRHLCQYAAADHAHGVDVLLPEPGRPVHADGARGALSYARGYSRHARAAPRHERRSVLHPLWTRLFPNAEIVMLPDYRMLPDFGKVDAAIWTLEQAAALARSHPGITAVVPQDLSNPFLLSA